MTSGIFGINPVELHLWIQAQLVCMGVMMQRCIYDHWEVSDLVDKLKTPKIFGEMGIS